jgi:tetratricopeptide (TPR) repeat protein
MVAKSGAFLLLPLLLLFLAGCAGAPKPVPAARLEAMAHTRRGIEQEAAGHRDRALEEFNEALRLQSSVENTDGMVVALINLARTLRLKGDLPAARAAIERAVGLLPEPSDLASELHYERAKILLASGELPAARECALKAESCEKGDDLGRRSNLVAAVLLRQGEVEQARVQAEKARQLNKSCAAGGEEANSWRLLGEIQLVRGLYDQAAECFTAALALDKELCVGDKIAADLRGLGGAMLKKSDVPRAIGFYRRALEVSLNRGDARLAAEDLKLLAQLYRQTGDPTTAEKLDNERKKLTR